MDCEKFDEDVLDALYGELPELTDAALRRHVESCARCGPAYASLKSAKESAVLPLEEPSSDLEDRILAAEKTVYGRAPWPRKLVRAAAWAGSHAMRPQLAMAALFMFVIGSSLLLLRARPGTVAAPVSVEQQGAPELARADKSERDESVGRPAPAARAAADDRDDKLKDSGNESGAAKGAAAEDEPAATAEASAAAATPPADGASRDALAAARALREREGCSAAQPAYEAIARNYAGTEEAKQATDDLSQCSRPAAAGGMAAKVAAPKPSSDATPPASAPPVPEATATVAPGPK